MHSTQNWFGISKRRPRRDWGLGKWGEEARMDREKLRVREEEHRDSEKDTGKKRQRKEGRKTKRKKKTKKENK